jgi:DNA-binding CsgD family transcriptional regulator
MGAQGSGSAGSSGTRGRVPAGPVPPGPGPLAAAVPRRAGRLPPLRGREREWRQILDLLRRAGDGQGHLLVLDGPPGIGKTRLLHALIAEVRRRRCVVFERSGWLEPALVRQFSQEWARLAGQLTGVSAMAGPAVLAWDDPQWTLGSPLPELSGAIATAPVLWVLTRRTTDGPHAGGLVEAPDLVTMTLRALPPTATAELLTDLLGVPPGADLVDLSTAAAGNPGALSDMVAGLLEEGLIVLGPDVAGLAQPRLPMRTQVRLQRVLGSVSGRTRQLVKVASMMGASFHLLDLCRLLGQSAASLLPAVEQALVSGLLVCHGEQLAFSHALVRSAVADLVPPSVRHAVWAEVPGHAVADGPTGDPARESGGIVDASPGAAALWQQLSDGERKIAVLIKRAMTNQQIATRVNLSTHTVNYHLRQIYRKLGVNSRMQLARLLPEPLDQPAQPAQPARPAQPAQPGQRAATPGRQVRRPDRRPRTR